MEPIAIWAEGDRLLHFVGPVQVGGGHSFLSFPSFQMSNLKLAVRMPLNTPVVTAVTVGSLALGIWVNAAIFSLTSQLLLRAGNDGLVEGPVIEDLWLPSSFRTCKP